MSTVPKPPKGYRNITDEDKARIRNKIHSTASNKGWKSKENSPIICWLGNCWSSPSGYAGNIREYDYACPKDFDLDKWFATWFQVEND